MCSLDIPEAPAFAQMCQYLTSRYAEHDLEETREIMALCGREPQTFQGWLLSHSDEKAFEEVGLAADASPIECVAVLNAASIQGESVIKGLLADARKKYSIHACIEDDRNESENTEAKVERIQSLSPDRISVSVGAVCSQTLKNVDGVFAVTDFYQAHPDLPRDAERDEQQERHARSIIDACAESVREGGRVKHLVLCTLQPAEAVEHELKDSGDGSNPLFDVKARVAAYARSKHLSLTFVIMPVYTENFFEAVAEKIRTHNDAEDGEKTKKGVLCISSAELGNAVANIYDSYEVYAGHEVGLVTNLSFEEASQIIQEVFTGSQSSEVASIQHDQTEKSIDIVAKDLGQMFRCYSKTEAVKQRAPIAKTLQLVPDPKPFKRWLVENRDDTEFREMLGIR